MSTQPTPEQILEFLKSQKLAVVKQSDLPALSKRVGRNYTYVRVNGGKPELKLRKSIYVEGFGNIFKSKLNETHKAILRKQYTAEELKILEVYI